MNIQEIAQAITQLSPDELNRFRKWFEEFERESEAGGLSTLQSMEEKLKKLRGSLKGTGALKALMEERRKE